MADLDINQCPKTFSCVPPNVSLRVGPNPSYVSIVFSVFSCLGCILIVTTYAAFKGLRRSVAQTVITHLAVADFFNAIGVIIGEINYLVFDSGAVKDHEDCVRFGTTCIIQSYITQWMSITSYIWTSILAVNFMVKYIFSQKAHYIEKGFPYLAVFAWLFPLLSIFPLLCTGKLGYSHYGATNRCYVRNGYSSSLSSHRDVIAAFIFANWIWALLSIAVVVVIFIVTVAYLRHKKKTSTSDSLQLHFTVEKTEKRLMLIPIFYVIIHAWDTVHIITSFKLSSQVHKGCTSETINNVFLALGILQGIGDSSQGWVNAILYIFASKLIRKKLFWKPFRKLIKRSISIMSTNSKSRQTLEEADSRHLIRITSCSKVALPPAFSETVSYPSETYFDVPYTDIGQMSNSIHTY